MSAIFGLFNLNDRPVVRPHLERMSAALSVHGPEGGGIWTGGNTGLGQRLMCFTPEDRFERQPLVHPSGKRVLVFDGRIDNRPDLMCALDISLEEASILPDSVFIQRAFEKWGRDCLEHLIGSFTFACWDAQERNLFIARSPVNGRPLFYHTTSHCFAFATMPKGLFALPHIPRELDEEVLADYLAFAPHEPGATFYRHVRSLPSGHWMLMKTNRLEVRHYWKVNLERDIHYPRDEDYVEAFNELFELVVGEQLRSQTPVGVMMSGGLDSSSVAATAAPLLRRRGKRLATFTEVPRSGFEGPIVKGRYADETPFVKAIARLYDNLDLNLIRTDGRVYLEDLDTYFAAAEVPFRNASNRVYLEAILQAAQRQGIGVLLTGGQGNLTISWNGAGLLPKLIYERKWLRALLEARALTRRGNGRSTWRALVAQGIMPLLPKPLWHGLQYFRRKGKRALSSDSLPWPAYSAIHPDFVKEKKVEERARQKGHDFHPRLTRDTRAIRLKTMTGFGLSDGLGTGYQALFGVEMRDPTTDVRIIEFCLAIPEGQFLCEGLQRRLIRRAMQDRLPPEVLWNKGRGLQAADWFERLCGAQDQILQELERMERSQLARRALDMSRLRRLVEEMPHAGDDAAELMRKYRTVLEFGLMTGCYILWVEKGG